MSVKVLYSDVDGTLLGPGGSLFTTPHGDLTLRAAEAIVSLHRADVKLVLVSGRTQAQMSELARVVSASAYISEMGALVVDRSVFPEIVHRNYGEFEGDDTPVERMTRSGAARMLLERYAGRLEPHTPWSSQYREATMLFRGHIDREEAQIALDRAYGWLDLSDNGLISRRFETLGVDEVHAYHLTPKGIGKAPGVRRHLEMTGIDPGAAAAVGDSRSDAELAEVVGVVFITANGRAGLGDLPPNTRFTEASHGEGFAEAVDALV